MVSAIHWHESAMVYMYSPSRSLLPPLSPSHPSGSSQCTSPEHLSHASNLGWWSVSPLMVYLFQCYSLRTSHPRLLPQTPKVCSIHLFFIFCFAYRFIVTIFLNSIYIFQQQSILCHQLNSVLTLNTGSEWRPGELGLSLKRLLLL